MDEQRDFFRIKNKGDMLAQFEDQALNIIDMSASSVAITPEVKLPRTGILELKINLFKIHLHFEVLSTNAEKTVLIFTNGDHVEKLLPVLKNLRRESE